MKIEFLNPFIHAAETVLSTEINTKISKGKTAAQSGDYVTNEVTIYMGVTGSIEGQVFYGMTKATALKLASHMMEQECTLMTKMVNSCISELGNLINGKAGMALEIAGYPCKVSPPTILMQENAYISTLGIKRINVPLLTELGEIDVCLGVREVEQD